MSHLTRVSVQQAQTSAYHTQQTPRQTQQNPLHKPLTTRQSLFLWAKTSCEDERMYGAVRKLCHAWYLEFWCLPPRPTKILRTFTLRPEEGYYAEALQLLPIPKMLRVTCHIVIILQETPNSKQQTTHLTPLKQATWFGCPEIPWWSNVNIWNNSSTHVLIRHWIESKRSF